MSEQSFSSPFNRFLAMREQIREELGDRLKEFGKRFPIRDHVADPSFIESGFNHAHYALGKVGDLWLATRENCLLPIDSDYCLAEADAYVADQLAHQSRLPFDESPLAIIGGVQVGSWPRYFLVVEDLSQGNTKTVEPAGGHSLGRRSDCVRVDNRIVRVDFHEQLPKDEYPAPYFLTPENLLTIDSDS